jgi:hypothetical protein
MTLIIALLFFGADKRKVYERALAGPHLLRCNLLTQSKAQVTAIWAA